MNTVSVMNEIKTLFPNAVMVRRNKSNFLAIPADEVDGVQTYVKVAVGALAHKDTERAAAFDFEAAAAEYTEWKVAADAKAAAPKAPKASKADPEKAAARKARQDKLLAWMVAHPGLHTSTEMVDALDGLYEGVTALMTCGTDASALVKAGEVVCEKVEGKKHYGFIAE